jgi:glycosyltransferase involved in cell wall biosynthesis
MKILVVQESDWIKRGPHNTHHLLERLSEQGHEVRVIDYEINWPNSKKHELISRRIEIKGFHKIRDNARITVIRPSILHVKPFNYLSLLYTHKKEIKRQISEFKPDVVIGLGILNARLAIKECEKHDIPFVYFVLDTLHTLVHEAIFQNIAQKVEQYNYRHSDVVVSVNKLLREYTIKMGADEKKAILLPHGIEMSRFIDGAKERERIRLKYGFKESDIVLFFMGYLYTFSGLVPAATYLKDNILKYRNIKLFIVGEGPIYGQLCAIGKDIPDNILVLGWQSYNEIPSIISASDICILPSEINDTMKNIVPIKVFEYLAAGKSVICTRLPGIKKEFQDNIGIHYIDKPEDILSLSISLANDKDFGSEGVKVQQYMEPYDWNNIAKQFELILTNVKKKYE